ncbi:putative porin [Flavobacterium tegetincola]|uniref:putative porin n=1 Tax=Flavobacterium tegetincola TaxID=150172 RepID=UPI000429F9ED|nr:putative porin [Flavobacterium tegetincola]
MLKHFFLIVVLLFSCFAIAQKKQLLNSGGTKTTSMNNEVPQFNDSIKETKSTSGKFKRAPIDFYKVISVENDTTFIDTSLTIQKEYIFNYLRKDNFGLLPFANEGQPYQTLDFGLNQFQGFPSIGFQGKHFNFLQADDIKYYSVPTPLTELYFKTVMEQGQSLDAFITVNTSENFNFSLAYKGLNSVGKYVNQLSSTGNFRFTTNYHTTNRRYEIKAHFTAQDISNGENGGIVNSSNFEGDDAAYSERARLSVFNEDATSLLDGKRYFIDQQFRINKTVGTNNLYIDHEFNFENKFYEFTQATIASTIIDPDTGSNVTFNRYGDSYASTTINDKTRYNRMYNKVGATYENLLLGKFQFFIEDFNYNYFYRTLIVRADNSVIASKLDDRINAIGGSYTYQKGRWSGKAIFSNSISDQAMRNLDVNANYKINEQNAIGFKLQNISKIPDHVYNLYQSSYKGYNWSNNFNNEKITNLEAVLNTKWINASAQISSLEDKLYFVNSSSVNNQIILSPEQFSGTIKYFSLKLSREFKYGKFALDNTFLYQQVEQSQDIINVPKLTARNTFYYSDHIFKRALFLQTGFTFNYFSKFYANDYNPIVGDFYVQNQKQIGDFPMFDFFINAKISQTRIYLKAEHFNSAFTGNDFYSAPSYPYRDFIVRFGIVWNFFQ